MWPHDCSIVAAGLARYGMANYAERILSGLFDASCSLPQFRMPELFCGFPRRAGEGPVSFPSACTPQAWASGAVFLLLQACLGIDIDAAAQRVTVRNPILPEWLDRVALEKIPVGAGSVSIDFERAHDGVDVTLRTVEGSTELVLSE